MRRIFTRARTRAVQTLTLAVLASLGRHALADQLQNIAVQGDFKTLNKAGYIGTTGTFSQPGSLYNIANIEAGGGVANTFDPQVLNTSPNSTLPNGNADLAAPQGTGHGVFDFQFPNSTLPAGGVNPAGVAGSYPAGLSVGNHASEVSGVISGLGIANAADTGIAVGASLYVAGVAPVGGVNANSITASNGLDDLIQQSIVQQRASVVNLSLGYNLTNPSGPGFPPLNLPNDGSFPATRFVDWATGRYNALFTIAGNEVGTEVDSPADTFNGITVGATGVRTATGALSYDQLSNYNVSNNAAPLGANATADGRIGISLVAPGGDPGPSAGGVGTFNTISMGMPAFDDQFQTTAGGQYNIIPNNNAFDPSVYLNDSLNKGVTTLADGAAADTTAPNLPMFNRPATNPGPALGGNDAVQSSTLSGTSFAAPLVAGAITDIKSIGANALTPNGDTPFTLPYRNISDVSDHRLIKAVLLNGASKVNVDGTLLTRADGTPWTKTTALQGPKNLPPALADLTVGPTSTQAQSGLDPQLGTGQLNVLNGVRNYLAGEQGPNGPGAANVGPIGWDVETVPASAPANTIYTYNFADTFPATAFQATLCWDLPVNIVNPAAGNTFQTSSATQAASTFNPGAFTDLDLYLFKVDDDDTLTELGWSNSNVDNVQHIYYQDLDADGDPQTLAGGDYQLDVVAPNGTVANTSVPYGLAWTFVPEPAALWLLALPAALLRRHRRRQAAA